MSAVQVTRQTVKSTVTLSGRGLHSGEPVEVRIHPGHAGIAFRFGGQRVEAVPENVSDTTRCTRLGEVSTIEHLMSAFAGLEITDAEVELSASELPGLDGSSVEYVQAIESAGIDPLDTKSVFPPFKRAFMQQDSISLAAARGEGHWRFEYLTGDRWPGSQIFEAERVHVAYPKEIAPARTLVLEEELPFIRQAGLGRGLDETSALVLGASGYRNASRFDDEPARHKLLDLLGDLYLSGIPARLLNVVAVRSGHRANVAFAKLLADASRRQEAHAEHE
ncbi:MAG TPA: UDP-3-O-acyl-N-acetylglucosamine deacetylase [Fimbriimonadaceae bacterium]|nr:UDP-3-O-acyl-N-acetylglucosamine deacetylase [Fimbriimonadaceae bacterium]